jgi:lipoate-protein ligase A
MESWRWIESKAADGATNMAIDQALLENAIFFGKPTMRVYRWTPHCLSLGYHQSDNTIHFDMCRHRHIDVVRRPTGGRAVLHAEEVTYAVIVPRNASIFQHSIAAVYNLISRGLLAGIQKLGVPAKFEKRSIDLRHHYKRLSSVSCFSAAARCEIVVNGKKLIGSAQRHLSNGILQHGSILLGSTHLVFPELLKDIGQDVQQKMKRKLRSNTVSLQECLGREVSFKEVVTNIKKGMEEKLSVRFIQSDLTKQEEALSRQLWHRFSILLNHKRAP